VSALLRGKISKLSLDTLVTIGAKVGVYALVETDADPLEAALDEGIGALRTDGARMFRVLATEGYTHEYICGYSSPQPGHVTLPGPHRVASLLKRWNAGSHRYRVEREHLQYYLDEFTVRFNRRRSTTRGMLFYRLLQQSVNTDPQPLHELIGGTDRPEPLDLPNEDSDTEVQLSDTFGEF
jgi:ISXO2-like transposase domain